MWCLAIRSTSFPYSRSSLQASPKAEEEHVSTDQFDADSPQPHPGLRPTEESKSAYWLMQPMYDIKYVEAVRAVHRKPEDIHDRIGLSAIQAMRWAFDKATGYGAEMSEKQWMLRFIFLETVAGELDAFSGYGSWICHEYMSACCCVRWVFGGGAALRRLRRPAAACGGCGGCGGEGFTLDWRPRAPADMHNGHSPNAGVPGFVAGMLRHMRSLRSMKRDHGWIHTLLEEAENEVRQDFSRMGCLLLRMFGVGWEVGNSATRGVLGSSGHASLAPFKTFNGENPATASPALPPSTPSPFLCSACTC